MMAGSESYIGAANGVVFCIDSMAYRAMKGRFYHAYSKEAVHFENIEDAVFKLEQFFDEIGHPCPSTKERTFIEKPIEKKSRKKGMRAMSDEELLGRHGDLGTFIIRVQHRQNSTWQGRITWTDENKTVNFRSIWEMVKLMESALDSGDETQKLEIIWEDEEKEG